MEHEHMTEPLKVPWILSVVDLGPHLGPDLVGQNVSHLELSDVPSRNSSIKAHPWQLTPSRDGIGISSDDISTRTSAVYRSRRTTEAAKDHTEERKPKMYFKQRFRACQ